TTANSEFRSGYGIGFEVLRLGDAVLYGHGGAVAGYQAAAYFQRSSRTGVIILRNVLGGEFDGFCLVRKAFEKDPAEYRAARQGEAGGNVDPKIYDAYVGRYEIPALGIITISREGGKLFGQPDGQSKEELVPKSETEFSVTNVGAQVT